MLGSSPPTRSNFIFLLKMFSFLNIVQICQFCLIFKRNSKIWKNNHAILASSLTLINLCPRKICYLCSKNRNKIAKWCTNIGWLQPLDTLSNVTLLPKKLIVLSIFCLDKFQKKVWGFILTMTIYSHENGNCFRSTFIFLLYPLHN